MAVETLSAVAAVTPEIVSKELSMNEYAAQREAEMRGAKPTAKPAAVATDETAAAATDKTAAATEEKVDGEQTPEDSAATENDEVEVEVEETHPAKQSINKKFEKLTNRAKEAKAEAETQKAAAEKAAAELAAARAELAQAKQDAADAAKAAIPIVKPAAEDEKPVRTDFDDPDEYTAALSAHAARSAIRESTEAALVAAKEREQEVIQAQEAVRQAKVQEQITELHAKFNERQTKALEEFPDYQKKVLENETLVLEIPVFFSIEKAELGPQLLYHLANNPAEAKNLNDLHRANPVDALIRIGELQAELRQARKPKVSKAAPVIKTVGNRASPERKSLNDMSMEEYATMREEQDRQAAIQRANRRFGKT